jgi:hypothetical protein
MQSSKCLMIVYEKVSLHKKAMLSQDCRSYLLLASTCSKASLAIVSNIPVFVYPQS